MMFNQLFPPTVVNSLLDRVGQLAEIPAGEDETARSILVKNLACNEPQILDREAIERAGLGTITRAFFCLAEVPDNGQVITAGMRFLYEGLDYHIRDRTPTPSQNPSFYVMFLELDQVS